MLTEQREMTADYTIKHWTTATTEVGSTKDDAIEITVNNRAATREAIIFALNKRGYTLVERSEWHAKPPSGAMGEPLGL